MHMITLSSSCSIGVTGHNVYTPFAAPATLIKVMMVASIDRWRHLHTVIKNRAIGCQRYVEEAAAADDEVVRLMVQLHEHAICEQKEAMMQALQKLHDRTWNHGQYHATVLFV